MTDDEEAPDAADAALGQMLLGLGVLLRIAAIPLSLALLPVAAFGGMMSDSPLAGIIAPVMLIAMIATLVMAAGSFFDRVLRGPATIASIVTVLVSLAAVQGWLD